MKQQLLFALLLTCFGILSSSAQSPIVLNNPSFEDIPRPGKPPKGWTDCGFRGETPPDVQPNPVFSVEKPAFERATYMSMVVRDNNTWERAGQQLSSPLLAGQCYLLRANLAISEIFISVSRVTEEVANYNTPVVFRIWGGKVDCGQGMLLVETDVIDHFDWREYTFLLQPKVDLNFLTLEVYYSEKNSPPYNGNLLIDNLSDIIPSDCDVLSDPDLNQKFAYTSNNLDDRDLDTLFFPEIRNPEHLESIILEEGPKILPFGEAQIDRSFYRTPDGEAHYQNPSIHKIARGLEAFPEIGIMLVVREASDTYGTNNRVIQIQQAFLDAGISNDRIVVRTYNKKDKSRDWILNKKDCPVLIRYIQL